MAEQSDNEVQTELVITRVFAAPRELVWQAWTDPERLQSWWGPAGFTVPVSRIDLRVGGPYLICMRSPQGQDFWSTGVYREIVPMERLVCTDSFADEEGNVVAAAYYGMSEDFPLELLVTVTLADVSGGTKMTLRHSGLPPGQMADQTAAGWNESFDKLAGLLGGEATFSLPSEREIVMESVFAAPRALVFRAFTEADLIPRWWGPARFTTVVDRLNPTPGGSWRFVQSDAGDSEYAFHGEFREVQPPARLVYTFEFEAMPGHIVLETVTLAQHGGGTKLTVLDSFDTAQERDGMLQSGMEEGAREGFKRLARLLVEL